MAIRVISDDNDEIRNISDDNDEVRVMSQHGGKYPYTYPFYYAEYSSPRDLSDPEG